MKKITLIIALFCLFFQGKAQTLLTENFDTSLSWTVGHPDGTSTNPGWTREIVGTTPTCSPFSGTGMARFNSYSVNISNSYDLTSPAIAFTGGLYRVKFKMYRDDGYLTNVDKIDVYYNTTQTSVGGTLVGTINRSIGLAPVESSNGWYSYSFTLPENITGDGYVSFLATTAYGNNIFIDQVIVEILPACVEPSALVTSNITSSSVELSWTENGSSASWSIEYGPVGFTQGTGTTVTATTFPYAVTGLSPATNYDFYVQSNCSTSLSSWAGPKSCLTNCVSIATFTENFDASTNLPICWKSMGPNFSGYVQESTGASSLPNNLYLYGSSFSGQGLVVMPPVNNAGAGTHRLKFKAKATSTWDIGGIVEVGYITDITDPTTFVSFQSFTTVSEIVYDNIALELGTSPGSSQNLAFRHSGDYNSIEIDDVIWEPIPACGDVNSLATIITTTTTAQIAWAGSGSETQWQYVYGANTVTDPSTLTPTTLSANDAILSGLTPATTYKYWVRSYCGAGLEGAWIGPVSFVTQCLSYSIPSVMEDFDSTSGTNLPLCWANELVSGTNNWESRTPLTWDNISTTHSGTRIVYKSFNDSDALLYSLPLNYTNVTAATRVNVFLHRNLFAAPTDKYVVFANTAPTLTGAVQIAEVFSLGTTAPVVSATGFYNYFADVPDTFNGQAQVFIIIEGITASSWNSYDLGIEDFKVEYTPTTPPACATGVTATIDPACGNYASQLTWQAPDGAEGYKLSIGTTAAANELLDNQDLGSVLNYSFTGNYNTTYFYKIVPYNTIGDATGCLNNTFTTFSNGCYCPSIPSSNDDLGITNVQLGNLDFPTPDVTYFDHTATTVDLPQGVNANLQIAFATGFTYDTNVWIDFDNSYTFDESELVNTATSLNNNPTNLDASFVMPATATLGVHKMRIGAADSGQVPPNPCFSGLYGVTLDFNVNIVTPPSCMPVNGLSSSEITSNSALISWTPNNPAPGIGYQYYVSTTNTPPSAITTPTDVVAANTNTVSISTLSPSTTYYVWVRSVCTSSDSSTWSSATSFTTLCVAMTTLPWTENFDSLLTGTNLFPGCWSNSNSLGSWLISTTPTANSGTNSLRRTWNTNGWAFTPTAALTAGSTYSFSYFVMTNDTTVGYDITVAVGNGQSEASMTQTLSTVTGYQGPSWTQFTYEFAPTVTGNYAFGLHVTADFAPNGINFDDFKIDTVLGTSNFNDQAFNFYPNPVKDILNLNYSKDITNVAVYNLLGQQVVTKNVNSNQSQIDMSHLASGTYMVKITSNDQVKTIKVIKQ